MINTPWLGEVLTEVDENSEIKVQWYQAATLGKLTGKWNKHVIKGQTDIPYVSASL